MNHDESRSQDNGGQGTTLLGAPSRRGPMNVFPLWKNILVATVCLLGALFAAPNIFQPDPAVQIRSLDADASIGAAQKARVLAVLDKAGVAVIGVDEDDGSLLVRLQDEAAQLGARSLIADTLNDNVRRICGRVSASANDASVAARSRWQTHVAGIGFVRWRSLSAPGQYAGLYCWRGRQQR